MIICGLKLTHDGSVALLDDGAVVFSVEMEKLGNNPRYSTVTDLRIVPQLLSDFGYNLTDVDEWVIDGWNGRETGSITLSNFGEPVELPVAPYRERGPDDSLLRPGHRGVFSIGNEDREYTSYTHAAGHLAAAYCTSPFAVDGEPSFVLVWDGGMFPRLYHVDPENGIESGGEIFPVVGGFYATAAHHFGPYRRKDEPSRVVDLSVAGKLMAYIGLGQPRPEITAVLADVFHQRFEGETRTAKEYRAEVGGWGIPFDPSLRYLHAFFREVRERLDGTGVSDVDVLASVHQFLQDLLLDRLTTRIREWKGDGPWNLCFVGGCALNIKWNSALRAHPMVRAMWVPPFPNDSGSAIGTAAAHLIARSGIRPIGWHTRLGPEAGPAPEVPAGWQASPCSPEELARHLHRTGEPVVVLNGRAELGPRALGGRSILAPATDAAMKDLLNRVKQREPFRPVAPICLTEHAPEIFDPGTPDPHMLFDHKVRDAWADRIPAILHVDGTARLQTVSRHDDPVLETVLREYHRLSNIPVLCNTSANHNGRGFFPDVASAIAWDQLDAVWSHGTLYLRRPIEDETPGNGLAEDRESLAGTFRSTSVAEAYAKRAPYPPTVDDILLELLGEEPRRVLDLGSGPGTLARRLAPKIESVDAVDPSPAMIEAGRRAPGGDHPGINWLCHTAEELTPTGNYGLIVAAKSLHWMDCESLLPRLWSWLSPGGVLAVVRSRRTVPWRAPEQQFLADYARSRPRADIVEQVQRQGLFRRIDERFTEGVTVRQTMDDYITSFHSMEAFRTEDLGPERTRTFRDRFRDLLTPYAEGDELSFTVMGRVTWGRG